VLFLFTLPAFSAEKSGYKNENNIIIFLNGTSSSGKSTVAKALQNMSETPLLTLGLDSFIGMLPPQYFGMGEKSDQGFQFIKKFEKNVLITDVIEGKYAKQLNRAIPEVVNVLSNNGFDLVVDELLLSDEKKVADYVKELQNHKVYFIGVYCSTECLREREILRGDRVWGLAQGQLDKVHRYAQFYDFKIDTSQTSPFESAKQILRYIRENPSPMGFKKLQIVFKNKEN